VNPLRLRDKVKGDIIVSLAGPLSNAILVVVCLVLLYCVSATGAEGKQIIREVIYDNRETTSSLLMPITILLYFSMRINVILGIFNLFPVPPLDGSHVITHMLPEPSNRII